MHSPIFITGTGTGIGKTVISAILVEALQADYWKPVQAGFAGGTDSQFVRSMITNRVSVVHDELFKLKLAASPHIAAKEEGFHIDVDEVVAGAPRTNNGLIVEGAGGVMVPLNEKEFVIDLAERLNAIVILVSRNYLGSINHSLLTAAVCRQRNIRVAGWIFNDRFMEYEDEIVEWSGYPKLLSLPNTKIVDKNFISTQAKKMRELVPTFAAFT